MNKLAMNRIALAALVAASVTAAKAVPAVVIPTDPASINITEPAAPDGNWSPVTSGINELAISYSDDHILITGITRSLPGDESNNSPHWLALMDPDGTTISDVLKLTVTDFGEANNRGESIAFEMWSQGDSGFQNAVTLLPQGYSTLAETTVSQEVGDQHLFHDNSGKLEISVLSQPDDNKSFPPTSRAVPDGGATLMLLGIGSAALATVRRFTR